MPDSTVSILIKTDADIAALTAYRDALVKLQGETALGTERYAELGEQIEKADKTLESATKQIGEAGEATEKFSLHGHEMHQLLRLIGGQAGEAGHLLHFLFSPELLGIAALVIGLKMWREHLEAVHEQLVKNIEKVNELHEATKKAHEEAEESARAQETSWARTVQHQHDSLDLLTQIADRQKALRAEEVSATEQVIAAEDRLAEAKIKADMASGKTSKEEGDAKLQALKDAAEKRKRDAEIESGQQENAAKQNRILIAGQEVQNAKGNLSGLREQRGDIEDRLKKAQALEEQHKKKAEDPDALKRVASAQADATKAREKLQFDQLDVEMARAAKDSKVKAGGWTGFDEAAFVVKMDALLLSLQGAQIGDSKARRALAEAETPVNAAKALEKQQHDLAEKLKNQLDDIDEDIKSQQNIILKRNELADKLQEEYNLLDDKLKVDRTRNAKLDELAGQTAGVNADAAAAEKGRKEREQRRANEVSGSGVTPGLAGESDADIVEANRVLAVAGTAVSGTAEGVAMISALRTTLKTLTDFINNHPVFKTSNPGDYADVQEELRLLNQRITELSTNVTR